ncbi:MAG TPA: sel1 repeat family protein, partial [Minicystis sp.]|nr:sel1 repeat family protein [Minicystis sp.]
AAGRAYRDGRGVGTDPVYAANLFDRVCARGNAEACLELAHQYRRGEGVKQSDAKARDLFDKACKLGLDAGCLSASKNGDVLSPRD